MADLSDLECDLILLNFFELKSVDEISKSLKMNPIIAQEHIASALQKLRQSLSHRGVELNLRELSAAISANAIQPPPSSICQSVATACSDLHRGGIR